MESDKEGSESMPSIEEEEEAEGETKKESPSREMSSRQEQLSSSLRLLEEGSRER
jgi:hypothetical protein